MTALGGWRVLTAVIEERLRTLERAYRGSGDPADLARWLAEAERRGVDRPLCEGADLAPLQLALACGSEAAALTLGVDQVSDQVTCFRSLCRELRLCTGRVGKSARGHLTASLLADLEATSAEDAHRRDGVRAEILEWCEDASHAHLRQLCCHGLVTYAAPEKGGWVSHDPARAVLVASCKRAILVMTPNNRQSSRALEELLNLVASGVVGGSKKMRRATRPQRIQVLARAKRRIEAWALARVAAELSKVVARESTIAGVRAREEEVTREDPEPTRPAPPAEPTPRVRVKKRKARLREWPRKRRPGRRR